MSDQAIEIKFKYPFNCYLQGSSERELDFEVEFAEGEFTVQAAFETGELLQLKTGEFKGQYFCAAKNLSFQLKSDDFLKAFVPATDELRKDDAFKEQIYGICIKVLNRVLINLRVYGMAPHIHKQTPNTQEAEAILRYWDARFRIDNGEWLPLFDPEKVDLRSLLVSNLGGGLGYGIKTPEIATVFKRDIIEAIQDDLEPPPEQEFWVNALEFLHERNYRMAVVESVIGLEIVLT